MNHREGPTPKDSLVFVSTQLHRQPGSSHNVERLVPISQDWGNTVSHAADDTEVEVAFLLESAHDGILIAAKAEVPMVAECVRCLEPLAWTEAISMQQFFAYPNVDFEPSDQDDEDVAQIEGDLLDLRAAFRDAVVLALPLSPVCRDDCSGLCSECGFAMAQDPEHRHERIDPRWSALAQTRLTDDPVKESD
jgi:uncharacterized protein